MVDVTIERLTGAPSASDIRHLAELLLDAVDSGAGVSFLSDLTLDAAETWWRSLVASASPRAVILVARERDGAIVGTVQLQPAWAPNQPHRADVAKLIVHRRVRGRGIARLLMDTLEHAAANAGFTLLLLDTCKGYDAERLYTATGWTRVGEVPRFALNPDGSYCDTVFFYKQLAGEPAAS
jgi:GNAT superfamily N-acetyltransferase